LNNEKLPKKIIIKTVNQPMIPKWLAIPTMDFFPWFFLLISGSQIEKSLLQSDKESNPTKSQIKKQFPVFNKIEISVFKRVHTQVFHLNESFVKTSLPRTIMARLNINLLIGPKIRKKTAATRMNNQTWLELNRFHPFF